ncbi:hypothetical protein ES707_12459 [subsurface metagenome]
MSNFFCISVRPELAANLVQILSNSSALGTIVGIVNSIKLKTDIIGLSVQIDKSTEIDAIKAKTDATPQKVRGHMERAWITTNSTEFVDLINITGQGKIWKIDFSLVDVGDNLEIKITVDGLWFTTFAYEGTKLIDFHCLAPKPVSLNQPTVQISNEIPFIFNLEFDTSLKIEVRSTLGENNKTFGCTYSLDNF